MSDDDADISGLSYYDDYPTDYYDGEADQCTS
jgi:hypothetical protein